MDLGELPVRPSLGARLLRLPLWQPLALRDFRLVWIGELVSVFGDQFYLVALPWLVLQVTGSALAVGTALMIAAIPRALLMLVGGAASDRFAPRTILLLSNGARAVLVAAVGWVAWAGAVHMWEIYLLVFAFGVADAFSFPAFTTFVACLVPSERLPAANGLLQGTAHVSMLVGPALGGLLITAAGTAPAFAFDAFSFVFAFATLVLVATSGKRDRVPGARSGLLAEIAEGLRYAWKDSNTRAFLVIIAAVNLSFAGPFVVGLATLAARRFGGAIAYGTMMSGVGAGALVGSLLSGSVGHRGRTGLQLIAITALFGLDIALVGMAPDLRVATVLTALLGLGAGYINVKMVAWLQARTPGPVLGRVMSLVMVASLGLQPLSYAAAGALADLHVSVMFLVAGALIVAAAAWGAANRNIREI